MNSANGSGEGRGGKICSWFMPPSSPLSPALPPPKNKTLANRYQSQIAVEERYLPDAMAFLLPLLPLLQLQYTLDTLPQTFSNAPRTLPTLTQKSNWMACGRNDVHHWNLPNGNVRFDTPLHIYLEERGVKSSVSLSDPMFLGRYVVDYVLTYM